MFKKLFEVNENDTVGTALWKGLTEGYVKSTLGVISGLGVAGLIVFGAKRNSEKKKVKENIDEKVENKLVELKKVN